MAHRLGFRSRHRVGARDPGIQFGAHDNLLPTARPSRPDFKVELLVKQRLAHGITRTMNLGRVGPNIHKSIWRQHRLKWAGVTSDGRGRNSRRWRRWREC